ncbi:MAG: hypothetical protein JWM74_2609 [Myxococcaceae bacterium]|nr:hypothetical protein [Myxococcaceae bacterium]
MRTRATVSAALALVVPLVAAMLAACSGHEGPAATSASDAGAPPIDPLCAGAPIDEPPDDLRCTGLYEDWETKRVAKSARAYAPALSFWSDCAEKTRFLALPEGTTIDASDPDEWVFPAGTKAWKEMKIGGRRVETRLFWKTRGGVGSDARWVQTAYVWSADETSARRSDGAVVDLGSAKYVVPKDEDCASCHAGKKDRLHGFDAVSLGLPGATGTTLAALADDHRIAPAPARTLLALGDDGTGHAAPALAWLHVNCGTSCHNDSPTARAFGTGLRLRLRVGELDGGRHAWDAIATAVDASARTPKWSGEARIVPGDPDRSLLVSLVSARGAEQMPPIATRVVDPDGIHRLRSWIAAMPP